MATESECSEVVLKTPLGGRITTKEALVACVDAILRKKECPPFSDIVCWEDLEEKGIMVIRFILPRNVVDSRTIISYEVYEGLQDQIYRKPKKFTVQRYDKNVVEK